MTLREFWSRPFWRNVAVHRKPVCARCEWIKIAPPAELVFFRNPSSTQGEAAEGERVRVVALAMHAARGHLE